ncbi:MAG: dephospho-CoA kinase [Verrucomicrobia bacterium]|nr:dephospho-CoA kinase [Deltaproteobacteria bacterium]
MRIIGLTGGIACGKSSVARFFQDRGAVVIDADQLARSAVEPGSRGLERVLATFGGKLLAPDGQLDRKRLASLVFSDPGKRALLEEILHPEIKRLAETRITQAAESGQKFVFYVAPLLIEAGVTDRVDEVWVVTVRPEVQLERLMHRDGIARGEAVRIIASQMPLAEKEKYGRILIDNSGTPEETASLLAEIWAQEIEGSHE